MLLLTWTNQSVCLCEGAGRAGAVRVHVEPEGEGAAADGPPLLAAPQAEADQ